MNRRRIALATVAAACVQGLAGCALPPVDAARPGWNGRLSVRIDSDPPQSFSAGFELQGDALQGRLALFSPLGSTLAELLWAPDSARLLSSGQDRTFQSLDALTRDAVGTALPVAALFAWLRGQPADFAPWQVSVEDRRAGRLQARRALPAPAVEMRLILD